MRGRTKKKDGDGESKRGRATETESETLTEKTGTESNTFKWRRDEERKVFIPRNAIRVHLIFLR